MVTYEEKFYKYLFSTMVDGYMFKPFIIILLKLKETFKNSLK